MGFTAQTKGLEFNRGIEPDVSSRLRGDPGRLRRIITNIVGNAIKFTNEGKVVIRARLKGEDDQRARLRFEVDDTGVGIPMDRRRFIFEAFTQTESTMTRRFGGTGLGLCIAKRLVNLMGGAIGVDSTEGEGSTFWFTIDLEKQPPLTPAATPTVVDITGARLLIVDDSQINRRFLTDTASSWGCRCDHAPNARTALKKLKVGVQEGDPFRVVLLNTRISGTVTSESLVVLIKRDPALYDARVVMMASLGNRGDVGRLEKIGVSAYLIKPVKQSLFHDCLVKILTAGPDEAAGDAGVVMRHSINDDRRRNFRILLVDDSLLSRELMLSVLKKSGFYADVAVNGLEALKALETTPYDLVFMDCQMPEMDGDEAVRVIRDPDSPVLDHDVPIIAFTAHARAEVREMGMEAGLNGYLSKPVAPRVLVDTVEKWLVRSRGAPNEAEESDRSGPRGEDEPGKRIESPLPDTVFDYADLVARLSGDEKAALEIIDMFIKSAHDYISSMKNAFAQKDAALARRAAHTLKGAARNVSAMVMQEIAHQVETDLKEGNLAGAAARVSDLEKQFEALRMEVDEIIKRS